MFVLLLHFYSPKPTPAYGAIAAALRDRGHDVWIGQPAAGGGFVLLDGARVVETLPETASGRLPSLGLLTKLRGRLLALRPDVVQVTPHPWSWVLAVGKPPGTRIVNDIRTAGSGNGTGLRGRVVDWSAWLSWRMGAALLYDGTTFLNEAGARWLFGEHWRPRATVVPLGEHSPRRVETGDVRFVYIGTISLIRNLEQLLRAAALVSAKSSSFSLTLVGPDDGFGGVEAVTGLIERHGLGSRVRLAPPVEYAQIPALLSGFDVAINYIPATRVQRRQTFMKVLECRALGVPQITTGTAANAEVVEDNATGLLADDTAEAYAAAMLRVIEDQRLLSRLRSGAHDRRAGVSWNDVASQYESLYRRLAETSTGNRG